MDDAVFVLEEGTNIWRYKDFVMREVEDYRWKMEYDNTVQIYESIYELITDFRVKFERIALFKLPVQMENTPSSCS